MNSYSYSCKNTAHLLHGEELHVAALVALADADDARKVGVGGGQGLDELVEHVEWLVVVPVHGVAAHVRHHQYDHTTDVKKFLWKN